MKSFKFIIAKGITLYVEAMDSEVAWLIAKQYFQQQQIILIKPSLMERVIDYVRNRIYT